MILHISTSIQGLLNNYKNRSLKGIIIKDGVHLNNKEAKKYLKLLLEDGHRLLPSVDCDNFDNQKGCLGHE